jgi:hypothetical protein
MKPHEHDIELAVQDGEEFSSIRLSLSASGAIELSGQDIGPTVREFFNHDDYEYIVTIPPEAVAKLAFELLKDRYRGNLHAVEQFRDYCNERGIPNKWFTWP